MSEKKAYQKFRERVSIFRDRIDRIENIVVDGMPDVNYCAAGKECWIEIKSPKEPQRTTTPLFGSNHKLSQSQKNWFLRQNNAGGNAFLLIETDKRLLLIDGKDQHVIDVINELTVEEIQSASCFWAKLPLSKKDGEELRYTIIENCL